MYLFMKGNECLPLMTLQRGAFEWILLFSGSYLPFVDLNTFGFHHGNRSIFTLDLYHQLLMRNWFPFHLT